MGAGVNPICNSFREVSLRLCAFAFLSYLFLPVSHPFRSTGGFLPKKKRTAILFGILNRWLSPLFPDSRLRTPVCLLCTAFAWLAASAFPCDTTIREEAFSRDRDVHRLAFMSGPRETSDQAAFAEMEKWLTNEGASFNAKLEWVNAGDPQTPWEKSYGIPSAPPSLPVAVLIGADKTESARSFVIDHWEPGPNADDLAAMLDSPVRKAIRRDLGGHWAVLLFSPGTGPDSASGLSVAESLAKKWSESHPPGVSIVTLDREDPAERLLINFAGIAPDGPDWLGIVFGRGKLMAPPLQGEEIGEGNLDGMITQVMEACTCMRPPDRMGVDIPMTWEPDLELTILDLESDLPPPENPAGLLGSNEISPREQNYWTITLIALGAAALAAIIASIFVVIRQSRANDPGRP